MSAPLPEIEITEEMLAAGVDELRKPFVLTDLAAGFLSPEEVATSVYRAMRRAAPANFADSAEITAAASQARRETIEECARICDEDAAYWKAECEAAYQRRLAPNDRDETEDLVRGHEHAAAMAAHSRMRAAQIRAILLGMAEAALSSALLDPSDEVVEAAGKVSLAHDLGEPITGIDEDWAALGPELKSSEIQRIRLILRAVGVKITGRDG